MRSFSIYNLETMYENTYLCTVFFMVLDLRLTKDCGCRETTLSILNTFLIYHHTSKTSQNYFNTSIPRFKKTTSCDPLINFMYLFDLQLQVIQKNSHITSRAQIANFIIHKIPSFFLIYV